jgi:DNA-binding MarR family transcriptional regulator
VTPGAPDANQPTKRTSPSDDAVAATLRASRALLGVVARSLAPALERVSFPQFRVLVLLSDGQPKRTGLLAEYLDVHPSTFTRMVDRLVSGGWVERVDFPGNRREVHVGLTASGADLVSEVMRRRRDAVAVIVGSLTPEQRSAVVQGLEILAVAAGEPSPEDLATLGG